MILNYYLDQPFNPQLSKQDKAALLEKLKSYTGQNKAIPAALSDELYNKNATSIYLYVQVGKTRIKVKTGFFITYKFWDVESQQVKKSFTSHTQFNLTLNNLKTEIVNRYYQVIGTETIESIQELRELVTDVINKKELKDVRTDFYQAFDEFIQVKAPSISPLTIKKYKTLLKLLKQFEEDKKYPLSFRNINLRFNDLFQVYLMKDHNQTNNTVGKYVSTLKTFMHYAKDRGIHTDNSDFVKFKVLTEQSDIFTLTRDELMYLYTYDFGLGSCLDKVRDVFCFSCFTGQRFSDLEGLRWDDIRNGKWHLRTKKTKGAIQIPLIKHALDILQKYAGQEKPLPMISNQKSNLYIKKACEIVGFDEIVTRTKYRGAERVEQTGPKYEFISFHTGRRNFCTINLNNKISPEVIMRVTRQTIPIF